MKVKYRSGMFCNHANECPAGACVCPDDCVCRGRMCETKGFDLTDAPSGLAAGRLQSLLEEHRDLLRRNLELQRTVQSLAVACERATTKLLSWEPVVAAAREVAVCVTGPAAGRLRDALNEAARLVPVAEAAS